MIYFMEAVFEQFESIAIPLIEKYGGHCDIRFVSEKSSASNEQPDEIHFVSFPNEEAFQHFLKDPQRVQVLHLKEKSVRHSILIRGNLHSSTLHTHE
jgi:uncharacterized protein (DUF1330 family)